MTEKKAPTIFKLGLCGAAGLAFYALVIRPRILRWGATDQEVARPLPGDELIPAPKMNITQAVTIRAPAREIWPWLVQIGYKRAGWYSHDRIHRLLRVAGSVDDERGSAERIIPELQNLQVGDFIGVAPEMGYNVAILEPQQAMVWFTSVDMGSFVPFDPAEGRPEKHLLSSWAWILHEIGADTTRLIVRIRQDYNPSFGNALMMRGMIEPGSFMMQQGSLQGIKRRAELRRPAGD